MESKPETPGERRRSRMTGAIMAAGEQLFATRAMEDVTIDEIVAVAGVAKGSFYNYFNDKERLAGAIVELVQGDCEFRIFAANRDITDPALRVVRALCVMINYALAKPERLQALLSLSERKTLASSPMNSGVSSDMRDGIETQRFSGITHEAGVLAIIGLFRITVRHVVASGSQTPPAALAAMVGALLLRGLGVAADEAAQLAEKSSRELLMAGEGSS